MNRSKFSFRRLVPILLALVAPSALAANITLSIQQAAGLDWNSPSWSDGNSATASSGADPSNTYEVLPGARLRSPNNGVDDTFPGQSLTVSGDGIWTNPSGTNNSEIRFKQAGGATGSGLVTFPKLIMNGGQLDTGNDGTIIIGGEIDILKNTAFYNDGPNDRGYQIDAFLTGNAPIEFRAYVQPGFMPAYNHSLNITGTSNTFSGKWNVVIGTLLATGTNGLGTNDITVGVNGALETTYDINNPQGSLQLNGQMYLHQNDSFRSVTVGTTALTKGAHTFDELSATFTNFPVSWTPQLGAEDFTTGSGSITVLNDNTTPVVITLAPTNTTAQVGAPVTFTVQVSGPVIGSQWYSNNVAITGANGLSYTTPGLTLAADQTVYKVVLTNTVNSVEASAILTVSAAPIAITLAVQQASGLDWNSPNNWSDGNPASVSAAANPANTYELLPGSRLRSPNNGTDDTFPGGVLTASGNGIWVNNPAAGAAVSEIRFKQLATDGMVTFPKLIMNGGQLDTGNGGTITIAGEINIAKNTPIYNDDVSDRGYIISARLTGSANIEYHGYNLAAFSPDFSHNLNIAGSSNTFSGKWNIVLGTLLGTGTNSLGTNDITIGANGALESAYDINDTTGSLILNGLMYLHQNDTFRTVTIGATPLAKGTYTFEQLFAAYPNFPVSWTPQLGAEDFTTGSGSLTVLEDNSIPVAVTAAPANARVLPGQTATFAVQISGPATNIQWYSNNVPIIGANSLTYTTLPATSAEDNTAYKVVLINNLNTASASATLTIGSATLSSGFLKDEVWFGAQYTDKAVLQDPAFTDTPTVTRSLSSFEAPTNQGDNYIQRVSGFFTPSVSGDYVFFINSDDQSDLYLSADTNSANKILIASETVYSDPRSWLSSSGSSALPDKRSDTFSGAVSFNGGAPGVIHLEANHAYYIEADHREGTGGDNLAVTFKLAANSNPQNGTAPLLTGALISGYAIDGDTLSITNSPQSVTVTNGGVATFSIGLQSSSTNLIYQWQRNGIDIPGANQSSYITPAATGADNQAQYRVIVAIPGIAPVTSDPATLTVGSQTTPGSVTLKTTQAPTGTFSFSFPSKSGVNYLIEYKNALSDSSWQSLPSVAGTGNDLTVSDAATADARFYRVGAQ